MSCNKKETSSTLSPYTSGEMSYSPDIMETIKNMTRSSCSYSSYLDANRSHLRLKMSSASTKPSIALPGGRSSMKIPSLLHKLPCHGALSTSSPELSTNGMSEASAVTLSALSVIEMDSDAQETDYNYDDIEANTPELSTRAEAPSARLVEESMITKKKKKNDEVTKRNSKTSKTSVVNLDDIDLDNIKMSDLWGLQNADGDTLRAKYLNKLSRKEREHVLQDIHGVADVMVETTNPRFVDDSLKKLHLEIDNEVGVRKASKSAGENDAGGSKEYGKDNQQHQEDSASTATSSGNSKEKLPALEEQLGKLQEKLDQLKRRRNSLGNSINEASVSASLKQISAKNHPMYGKLGDIAGFSSFPGYSNKNKTNVRPNSVPSTYSGGFFPFLSPTTAMAKSLLSSASRSNTNEAQDDAAILKNKNAIAYEQALAQCRGRRRERNNSLFRPNLYDDSVDDDYGIDDSLYIDVEQRKFRLSFLRAEHYDVKKAATRLIDYFEEKRRLFGVDNLTTKIPVQDLDAETKDCLESGHFQLLPGRDRAGRAVIVATKKLAIDTEKLKDKNSILRAFWVLCSIALEDVKTETNGVVLVNYELGAVREERNDVFYRRMLHWGNVLRALPLRVASIHWCVDNHSMKQSDNLTVLMLGGSNFVRVRLHAGSDMEVQYNLNSFGIPTSLLPVSMSGEVELSFHNEFLQKRKKIEASTLLNKALALVEAPMLDDCIAIDVSDGDQDLEACIVVSSPSPIMGDRFAATPVATPVDSLDERSNNFHPQNQARYQQEQQRQNQQEMSRTTSDYRYDNAENNMNKMVAAPYNDSFCFMGNSNPMEVQSSMQQQYQQPRQKQQRLNNFQQQHLGMNMNMNMGMVQQFSQSHQLQSQQHHHQSTKVTAESKSGISYSMDPVLVPGELDILLGRGRGAQNHKGNIHYRQVVETFRSRYEQIPQKGAKTQLIREVVAVIYDNGGRFLKQDGFGRWIPVDPEVARDKVSHSFRNQKRLSVGGNTPANVESSSSSKKRSRDEMK